MKYQQGDIVLIPYPYTDLSGSKQRPAVIVSRESANKGNYIVAKITSVIRSDAFSFQISPSDIDRELKSKSEVRTNELFTVSESIIIKKFGSFKRPPLERLLSRIGENISLD